MNRNDHGNNKLKKLEQLSKAMSYILRHKANDFGLKIDSAGFMNVDDLLSAQPIRKFNTTMEMIEDVVALDKKGRYELIHSNPTMIRAVQGHSMKTVSNEDALDEIDNIWMYPVVLHGTYFDAWEMIRTSGLNRMSRNAIHFSIGHSKAEHVVSGMRNDCEVYVHINPVTAFYNRIKFYISKNKVVLTPGIEGVLPTKYFKKVFHRNGKVLYSQTYELACLFELKSQQVTVFELNGEGRILHKMSFVPANNLNLLSQTFIDQGHAIRPFVVVIKSDEEKEYVQLIQTRQREINHIGFYLDYVLTDLSSVEEIRKLNLNTTNAKTIEIDLKKHFTSNVGSGINTSNSNSTTITSSAQTFTDNLTKEIILDETKVKHYLLLFLNFDQTEHDLLTSIDTILIPQGISANTKPFRFTLDGKKQIKHNIDTFLYELNTFLLKEVPSEERLILCTDRDDLDYLSQKFKKNSIPKPNLFARNIIILNSKDFSELEADEIFQAAEIFHLQYILDKETKHEADMLITTATKKLQPGCWEAMCSSKDKRLKEALFCYESAGNMYKISKNWYEAGECFEKCGRISEEMKDDAEGFYEEAASCYKHTDKKKSSDMLNRCLSIYEHKSLFSSAGSLMMKMAEENEKENNLDEAYLQYTKAASYFQADRTSYKTNSETCLIKQADLACLLNKEEAYIDAKVIYDKIGMDYLTNPMTKYSAKDLFLKCVIVFYAYDDHISADSYLNKYLNEDFSFNDTREAEFLREIIQAGREKNQQQFQSAVAKFKRSTDLDQWTVEMLNRILIKFEQAAKHEMLGELDDYR